MQWYRLLGRFVRLEPRKARAALLSELERSVPQVDLGPGSFPSPQRLAAAFSQAIRSVSFRVYM